MALQVEASTIAAGKDVRELLDNVASARKDGWVASGAVLTHGQYLTQAMVKFTDFHSS
jgi:hypothetical protein